MPDNINKTNMVHVQRFCIIFFTEKKIKTSDCEPFSNAHEA